KDYREAMRWYLKAAAKGALEAQHVVGVMYARGEGVPQNDTEAVNLYRVAAEHGYADSQNNLGVMYHQGRGVLQDFVQAHLWFNLAAAAGNTTAAKNRDAVASEMTPGQISEAQRLAKSWSPSQSNGQKDAPTSSVIPPANIKIEAKGTGTAFVISPDGLLLTAYHVVSVGKIIEVQLHDGKKIPATVVKALKSLDLAVLKIDAVNLKYLPVSENGTVKSGNKVFTVGYPATGLLGNEAKFTDGSISSMTGPDNDATFMQISVPIQPGNSGGPLLNERGEVIGIITATAAVKTFLGETGSLPQNINWAINSDFARPLLDLSKVKPLKKAVNRQEAIDRAKSATFLVTIYD
ncbi:MAG: trypsin-like peptidase domain-containing protein, partial [Desulfuromonadales bacterium]|nr:trypsin-like peptidase domain-containing protein [Desulfuromonadales bacterium]